MVLSTQQEPRKHPARKVPTNYVVHLAQQWIENDSADSLSNPQGLSAQFGTKPAIDLHRYGDCTDVGSTNSSQDREAIELPDLRCDRVGEVFPDTKRQRCIVYFYRNVFSVVPRFKMKLVAKMLKAIRAQESKKASREKSKTVVAELCAMKLEEAARKVEGGIEETLTCCDFPSEHWMRIRANNVIEQLNREIRRRTRVVGTLPDSNSALMLACARLRHVADT